MYVHRHIYQKPYTLVGFELGIFFSEGGRDDHNATPPGSSHENVFWLSYPLLKVFNKVTLAGQRSQVLYFLFILFIFSLIHSGIVVENQRKKSFAWNESLKKLKHLFFSNANNDIAY
jgi:hypothetical protein